MLAPPSYKAPLTDGNLKKLNDKHSQPEFSRPVAINELEYPCNDMSYGVQNFSEWSYFRRPWHKVLTTHSSTWSKEVVSLISKQAHYQQKIRSWDPSDAPKKKRFSKSTFKQVAGNHKTQKGGKAKKTIHHRVVVHKPKNAIQKANIINNLPAPSKIAASDGGGSHPLVGAVGGTKKVTLNVPTNKKK